MRARVWLRAARPPATTGPPSDVVGSVPSSPGPTSSGNISPGRAARLRRSPAAPTTTGPPRADSRSWSASSTSTTSAMTAVTLSGAPAARARSTSSVTAAVGSADLGQHGLDRGVGHHPAETITAQQVAIPDPRLTDGGLALRDPRAVDRAQQQVALGMAARLVGRDPAGVDEGLHVRVVVGYLAELAVAQEVRPGVPDVDQGDPPPTPEHRGEGGPHPRTGGIGLDELGDPLGRGRAWRRRGRSGRRRRAGPRSPAPRAWRPPWSSPARLLRGRPCRRRRPAGSDRRSPSPRCRDAPCPRRTSPRTAGTGSSPRPTAAAAGSCGRRGPWRRPAGRWGQ